MFISSHLYSTSSLTACSHSEQEEALSVSPEVCSAQMQQIENMSDLMSALFLHSGASEQLIKQQENSEAH